MIAVEIAIVIFGLCAMPAGYRMLVGPSRADRATAADLMVFLLIGMVALIGFRNSSGYTLDIVLVAALVAFLSTVSYARVLLRGDR
ncbi:multicomponent Na+:H+ antiporter subunit F [Corynebacterium mycetoides]|uniref:Multicomponent Na+:H+ antiporter subunit F n=1 Tax=Corynebacterium mycetoides TaxID=38302 RepID=A0A1G9Q423_9CORY|nr:monovalent cation/H+ antiporter complex subunit F [Corynebacterium mycetoides]SDM05782.1 multicomponent Na+:H+ antiporter subunit F [Corynebacterium mycetoides]